MDEKQIGCEECRQPASVCVSGRYQCGSCFLMRSAVERKSERASEVENEGEIEGAIKELLTGLPPAVATRIVRRLAASR